ncbi:MAG: response regulator [Hydrococcus sp. SU_1_0]|nr:response regulator [Hydrococcus sp. SU_1_0]
MDLLVVNDCINTVYILEDYFKHHGYDVITAHDGEAAWLQYQQYRPDIIISDSAMPGADGYEFLKRVREFAPQQPFIMHSPQMGMPKYRQLAEKLGASFCLTMPFEPDELLSLVRSIKEGRA